MAFVKRYTNQEVEAPPAGIELDQAAADRLRCGIMVGMQENGWSHRDIAYVFKVDQGTVSRRLAAMPDEARKYYAEKAAQLMGGIVSKASLRKERPSRAMVSLDPRTPLDRRRAEAEARIDAKCLAAVERLGGIPEAARFLGIALRRVRAAVERREAST